MTADEMIDITKPLQTRDGRKVIWVTDCGLDIDYPIICIIDGLKGAYNCTKTGRYEHNSESHYDLLNVEPVIAAGRNPEKLTVDQIKGYRCLSDEEFEALQEGSKRTSIYFLSPASTIYEVANYFNRYEHITYFTDRPEGYFLPKLDTLKPYWSKPEDVPIQQGAIWLKDKGENKNKACLVLAIGDTGLIVIGNYVVTWEELKDRVYYNGTEWKECRCESI